MNTGFEVRPRRGVPYFGVKRDIQVVMQNNLDRGRDLDALLQRVENDVQVQRPALDFLANHAVIPDEARSLAANYYQLSTALLHYLGSIRTALDAWTFRVESALSAAQGANDHTLIDPSPGGMGGIGSEFRVISTYGRSSLGAYHDIEEFLNANAQYMVPPPSFSSASLQCDISNHPGAPGSSAGNASGGVMAAPRGVPQAMHTHRAGYDAGWDTQARFFQMGTPIAHNQHHRRYQFLDRSYVDLQAHRPALTTSADSDLMVLGTGVAGAVVGGRITRRLGGALLGGAGGAAVAAWARPYDAAWQGYSARYYATPDAQSPWGTRYFYGWRRSSGVTSAVRIEGSYKPADFPNFADNSAAFSWWRWHHGHADAQTAAFDGCGQAQRQRAAREHAAQQGSTDLLAQAMAGFAPQAGSAIERGGSVGHGAVGGNPQALLAQSRVQAVGHG